MSMLSRWLLPGLDQIEGELECARLRAQSARVCVGQQCTELKHDIGALARSPITLALAACGGFLFGDSPTRARLARIEDALARVETEITQSEATRSTAADECHAGDPFDDPLQAIARYLYLAQMVMSLVAAPDPAPGQAEDDDDSATAGFG